MTDRAGAKALNIVGILLTVLLLWEAAVRIFSVPPFLLPKPSVVVMALVGDPFFYLRHTMATVSETAIGFGSALVIGLILSVGIVYSRLLEQTLYTLLVTLQSIPKVALAPLFIIWLGTGTAPIIAIVFFVAIFPIVMNSVQGLRSVDPEMLDLARSMRGSGPQTLWKIRFPNALPAMFTGCKIGISMAFTGAVVGEFVTSVRGLGYLIIVAQSSFDTTQMFAAVIMLALTGTLMFFLVEFVESIVIPWHVSHRRSSSMRPARGGSFLRRSASPASAGPKETTS